MNDVMKKINVIKQKEVYKKREKKISKSMYSDNKKRMRRKINMIFKQKEVTKQRNKEVDKKRGLIKVYIVIRKKMILKEKYNET